MVRMVKYLDPINVTQIYVYLSNGSNSKLHSLVNGLDLHLIIKYLIDLEFFKILC